MQLKTTCSCTFIFSHMWSNSKLYFGSLTINIFSWPMETDFKKENYEKICCHVSELLSGLNQVGFLPCLLSLTFVIVML